MSKTQELKIKPLQQNALKCLLICFSLLLMGCEGFKFTGSMCESLQPGQVSGECRAYDEEEAEKASVPVKDDSGECLKCNEPEKLEIRQ